jgi:hypothetical protein
MIKKCSIKDFGDLQYEIAQLGANITDAQYLEILGCIFNYPPVLDDLYRPIHIGVVKAAYLDAVTECVISVNGTPPKYRVYANLYDRSAPVFFKDEVYKVGSQYSETSKRFYKDAQRRTALMLIKNYLRSKGYKIYQDDEAEHLTDPGRVPEELKSQSGQFVYHSIKRPTYA